VEGSGGKTKVLVVVEDDLDMRTLIRITLAQDPRLEVVGEASSADEALALVRTTDPGLIVLDHTIDGAMTGLEAAPLLKAAAPHVKILLFTAYDLAAEARAEPAIDGYLRKDEFQKLLPTVERLLALAPLPG
jgi:DNA-binding NarL/FixJ family response regulator